VPLGRSLESGDARLLRDRDEPSTFRSFGSWPDLATVERFREELRSRDEVYPDD